MRRGNHLSQELLGIVRNRKVLISVTAVLLVPLLYSFMFLWAFWDPYARMDVLPVAVVNMDQGAELNGKQVIVGEQFVEKLRITEGFEWNFVSQSQAQEGLENGTFYMAIEIPEDFSLKASKVMDPDAEPAVIRYIPKESANFLAAQIGKTAVERLKSELSAQLTKTYTETLFDNVHKLSDGLAQAADGAQRLNEGTLKVENGVEQLDEGLGKLSSGTAPLRKGATELTAGAGQLKSGLGQLQEGALQLSDGLGKLEGGHKLLVQGGADVQSGLGKLSAGLSAAADSSGKLQQGAAQLASGLQKLAAEHPELASDRTFMAVAAAGQQLKEGMDTYTAAQSGIVEGAERLAAGQSNLQAGLVQFGQKLAEAHGGSQSLAAGLGQVVPASGRLESGLSQLASGMDQLANGSRKLNQGAKALVDGALAVADGTGELSGKLSEAAVQTGAIQGNDTLYQMFSRPVELEEHKLAAVPNYGTGFAPYFLSLGLFVGALLLTIVFPVKEPVGIPRTGLGWYWGKLGTMLLVGMLQALVMDLIIMAGLGLEVQNTFLFIGFSILTSWTFMILIQLLVATLGDPGRFVAIVLLILQLTTSAGTFPVELIPDALQAWNVWLPMTYTVQGYKAVISSGDWSDLQSAAGMLSMFIAGMAAATMVYFVMAFRRRAANSSTTQGEGSQTIAMS